MLIDTQPHLSQKAIITIFTKFNKMTPSYPEVICKCSHSITTKTRNNLNHNDFASNFQFFVCLHKLSNNNNKEVNKMIK